MTKWSGKTRGGTFGYKFFILLIKYSHRKVVYGFLRLVALYYFFFARNRSIVYYFKHIHGQRGLSLQRSILRNYVLLGEVLIDKISFLVKPRSGFDFDFDGEEHLRAMVAGGQGGLLIGAHMGNWEVAGNLLERLHTKVNVLMLDAEHERIKALLAAHHVVRKFNVIPISSDFSHLEAIKAALGRNELVVMHGDRFVEGNGVVGLPFLGKEARFPVGPLYMASKFRVPVSFVFTMKEGPTKYHFYASRPRIFAYPARVKTRQAELAAMVRTYVDELERMVRKYPEQWFNYYPFWEEEEKRC